VNDNPSSEPGKYKISFEDSSMPSIAGSYWIVQVGDIPSGSKQYPWAIVSVPFQAMLWVLVRDPEEFSQQYEQSVMQTVADLGFTYFFNKPIKTYQSKSECSYAAEPPR
jgi:lipocalin